LVTETTSHTSEVIAVNNRPPVLSAHDDSQGGAANYVPAVQKRTLSKASALTAYEIAYL